MEHAAIYSTELTHRANHCYRIRALEKWNKALEASQAQWLHRSQSHEETALELQVGTQKSQDRVPPHEELITTDAINVTSTNTGTHGTDNSTQDEAVAAENSVQEEAVAAESSIQKEAVAADSSVQEEAVAAESSVQEEI